MKSHVFDTDLIKMDFQSAADWRRKNAHIGTRSVEHLRAADLLDSLATTVDDVETPLLNAYGELFEDCTFGEAWRGVLDDIGFGRWPDCASDIIKEFVQSMRTQKGTVDLTDLEPVGNA